MKTADMKLGEAYAKSGHRDWRGDTYEHATKVTLLDKRTWYDDSAGRWYGDRKTRSVTPQFGGPVKLDENISTLKRSFCKRGVLVRVESGWDTGSARVVPFQQIVDTWDGYAARVVDNKDRYDKARVAAEARGAEEREQRKEMLAWAAALGIEPAVVNVYGQPILRLTHEQVRKLVGKE
jgi:hypothetical protein